MTRMSSRLLSRPFSWYKWYLCDHVKHLRGTYRFANFIDRISQVGMAKIDESNAQGIGEYACDNIIILDACRFDTFRSVVGKGRSRITLGGCTPEYVWENFSNGDYDDVVYVTGNPQFSPQTFHARTGRRVDGVFHEVFHTYETGWSDQLGTVPPGSVLEDLNTARKLFPHKKIIAHFMQPHIPFLDSDVESSCGTDSRNVWRMAEMGLYDQGDVKEAYRNNLEYIWSTISKPLRKLDGRTLVTSDHGNFLGENGRYGHTDYSKARALREVPLLEL